jgi:hypothetical protein
MTIEDRIARSNCLFFVANCFIDTAFISGWCVYFGFVKVKNSIKFFLKKGEYRIIKVSVCNQYKNIRLNWVQN